MAMEDGFAEEGVFEVEDLLQWQLIDGKDHYLVKWKGYSETSWEPDENIGQELSALKEAARQRTSDGKRKRDKKDKKEKKEKKRRKRGSSDERRKGSDSESSKEDDPMNGPGMMGMPPGMMPGMMPGFPGGDGMMDAMGKGMMPGMMPGMMDAMGKGMMMMKGGKGMPGKGGMPPFGCDPMAAKGMMMGKGKCGPFGKGGPPFGGKGGPPFGGKGKAPQPGAAQAAALDTQRFAVEKKRRLREFAGALHAKLASEPGCVPEEKVEQTKEFEEAIDLKLEDNQLPVMASSELIIVDVLWLMWVFGRNSTEEQRLLLMNMAKLVKASGPRARQLLMGALRKIWPAGDSVPSGASVQLFSALASILPPFKKAEEHNGAIVPLGDAAAAHTPEFWREKIMQLYTEHNPSKLGDVDTLLAKYRGREQVLYTSICSKYKVQPKPELAAAGGSWPAAPGMPAAETDQAGKVRELICELYRQHNPAKLEEVAGLFAKYQGKEEQLYHSICEKYKVEPKLPKKAEDGKEGKNGADKFRHMITKIYEEHNKDKVSEIDGLMKKYAGKEKTLCRAICKKYKLDYKKEKKRKKEPQAPSAQDEQAQRDRVEKIKPLIVELYQEHNPSKLDDIDNLLTKYSGREETLYFSICEKYKAEPKIQKTDSGAAPDGAGGKDGKPDDKEAASEVAVNGSKQPPAPTSLAKAYADLIREVYTEHNPEKLDSLPRFMEKYVDQEQELYLTICRKYNVTPKDPQGLGDLAWLQTAEERLGELLTGLVSSLALHAGGLKAEDADALEKWDAVRVKPAARTLLRRFELAALGPAQAEQLLKELQGEEDARWKKLEEKCADVEVKASGGAEAAIAVSCDGGARGRQAFDSAVASVTDAVAQVVRECMDAGEGTVRRESWALPWAGEEVLYVGEDHSRREVGVEYRRGCWTPRRRPAAPAHSLYHALCGPDVEARLPRMWRELADKLWLAVLALSGGSTLPVDAMVVIEATGGHEAASHGSARPSAAVVVTAPTEDDLEKARAAINPVLAKVLSDLQINALFAPTALSMPQLRGVLTKPAAVGPRPRGDSSSSGSGDEGETFSDEDVMSDVEPTDAYRPIRLQREKVRDAYLQGLLCLNCDAADHKHQDCPFKRKVCWNCHGNHPGNDCPLRCRFCKERHDYPLLECVKRVCRRVSEWKKSKPAQEQRGVLSSLEQLEIKLSGFEDLDLAKHNREVQKMVKELAENSAIWPAEMEELAVSILDMKPPKPRVVEQITPPPPPGPPPKPQTTPALPKELPPAMPENKYPWSEKIFLDELLTRGMYGSNVLSRIIGRGGMHHRRMETESGARVFFRGLGVSGRDAELADPIDCRLHISVKGEVPQQGKSVRRIIADIVGEVDAEIAERGEAGPQLDRPRDADMHPFGFFLPKGVGPENDGPLKFKFPEEDGQTLNDLLGWLKHSKLPLELDSDTQWRTTLQVTPTDPALPDDGPEGQEAVASAFNRLVDEWHHPSPYWFEEHDLKPTGLWTSLTERDEPLACPVALQENQGVRLTAESAEYFANLLEQADLVGGLDRETVLASLRRLRGVVRRQVEDEQLLLFLSYPWAWFSEFVSRGGLRLPFGKERVHEMLIDLGRVGSKPTESCPAPSFRGFAVEWLPIKAGAQPAADRRPLAVVPEAAAAPVATLALPAAPAPPSLPAAGPPQDHLRAPLLAQPSPPALPGIAAVEPKASDAPRGYCKCWLPEAIFASGQDLHELIAGPGGTNFAHVLKKYPSVHLGVEGQASTAAPPAHRMHVVMSSEDSEVFESAAADVLDLVETVCDMVGEELGLSEEQVEELIQAIRAEKYFEAQGIRTPLPPVRSRTSLPEKTNTAASGAMDIADLAVAAAEAGAPPTAPAPKAAAAGDFEFVDDDLEVEAKGAAAAAADGDDTEDDADDARTEASDCLSDITEDEAPRTKAAAAAAARRQDDTDDDL